MQMKTKEEELIFKNGVVCGKIYQLMELGYDVPNMILSPEYMRCVYECGKNFGYKVGDIKAGEKYHVLTFSKIQIPSHLKTNSI